MHMGGLMAFNLEWKIPNTVQVLLVSGCDDPEEGHKHEPKLIVRIKDIVVPGEPSLEAKSLQGPNGEPSLVFDLTGRIVELKRWKRATKPWYRGGADDEDFGSVPSMSKLSPEATLREELTGETVTDTGSLVGRIDLVSAGGTLRSDKRSRKIDPSEWKFTGPDGNKSFKQYATDHTKLKLKTDKREQIVLSFRKLTGEPLGQLTFRPGKKRYCAVTCFPESPGDVVKTKDRTAPHFPMYPKLLVKDFDMDPPIQVENKKSKERSERMEGVYPVKCMPTSVP